MGKFWVFAPILVIILLSCSNQSEKPAQSENKAQTETIKENSSFSTLQEANQKLAELLLFTGKLSIQNGTTILEIWNPLQANTLYASTLLEGLYDTLDVYCNTNLKPTKIDLKVYYNLNGKKDLLLEVESYKSVVCNAVKNAEKQSIPNIVKGALILNSLRNANVKVGNREWLAEICKDKRIKLFCSHLGF